MGKAILCICLILFLCQPLIPQTRITTAEAKKHIGEELTVCGNVTSARYAEFTPEQPTVLNLDRRYPNPAFTVVICGRNRKLFGNPDKEYLGKRICVTGKIEYYKGVPEIEAKTAGQIVVER